MQTPSPVYGKVSTPDNEPFSSHAEKKDGDKKAKNKSKLKFGKVVNANIKTKGEIVTQ